jgi:hypothetical protein
MRLDIALGFLFISSPLLLVAGEGACGTLKNQTALKAALSRATEQVIVAIEHGDSVQFMASVSPRGMGFGVDVPVVTKADLRRQMRTGTGYYCLLFSSACMAAAKSLWQSDPVLSKFQTSYHDWLTSMSYNKDFQLLTDSDLCGGLVRFITPGARTAPGILELEFVLQRGRWLLVNTPFELGE